MTADPTEYLRDATKKQHMRHAVQPNPDLHQVAIRENTLRKGFYWGLQLRDLSLTHP